eukprot:540714_1
MDPFHVWIKTKHDLNAMNDEEFKSIENEILQLFNGVKGLINLALKNQYTVDYNKLIQLSQTIQNNSDGMDDEKHENSLLSISDNSLSHIYSFLSIIDQINLLKTNSVLFYASAYHIPSFNRNQLNCIQNIKLFDDPKVISNTISKLKNKIIQYSAYQYDYQSAIEHNFLYHSLIDKLKTTFYSSYSKWNDNNNNTLYQNLS